MKTAIVTGASAGIGRAVAERMLAAGWHVGLVARRADLLHELADPYAGRAVVLPLDVTDADAVQVVPRLRGRPWPDRLPVQQCGHLHVRRAARRDRGGGLAPRRRREPHGHVPLRAHGLPPHATAIPPRRSHHQQRLHLRPCPARGAAPYTATKHAITGLTRQIALDGRPFDIACGQIDIGNAETDLLRGIAETARAKGQEPPPTMDVAHVAEAVLAMAELPLSANTLFQTIMATKMPYVGRGCPHRPVPIPFIFPKIRPPRGRAGLDAPHGAPRSTP
jgi:NAD(P)-dependent dehydrogenase (short-subunit alcohol dehydrogenase family)